MPNPDDSLSESYLDKKLGIDQVDLMAPRNMSCGRSRDLFEKAPRTDDDEERNP